MVGNTLEQANRKALKYGDGKAWDNRKKKIYERHTPRGKVYQKLRQQEWKRAAGELKDVLSIAQMMLAEKQK